MSRFNSDKRSGSYCLPKIVKRAVGLSRSMFTANAQNVRLQHEFKRVDADAIRQ